MSKKNIKSKNFRQLNKSNYMNNKYTDSFRNRIQRQSNKINRLADNYQKELEELNKELKESGENTIGIDINSLEAKFQILRKRLSDRVKDYEAMSVKEDENLERRIQISSSMNKCKEVIKSIDNIYEPNEVLNISIDELLSYDKLIEEVENNISVFKSCLYENITTKDIENISLAIIKYYEEINNDIEENLKEELLYITVILYHKLLQYIINNKNDITNDSTVINTFVEGLFAVFTLFSEGKDSFIQKFINYLKEKVVSYKLPDGEINQNLENKINEINSLIKISKEEKKVDD